MAKAGPFVNQKIFFFAVKNMFMFILSGYKLVTCFMEYKEHIKHHVYKKDDKKSDENA